MRMALTDAQKQTLLRIARDAVVQHVTGQPMPAALQPDLPDASGVFVTLKRRGELRGCLGTLECRESLAHEVARCARDSASIDPRFTPVATPELPEISVEISVLGPLEEIDPLADGAIVIGQHGVVVEQGHRRGLLLPQVAIEWGWTKEQFLRQTCRKAGLPDDGWEKGARVFRFEAAVFGE
jgi:AmmeMemoRadiSam system protein A